MLKRGIAALLIVVFLVSGTAYANDQWKGKLEPDLAAKFGGPSIMSETTYRVVVWGDAEERGSVVYRLDVVGASVVEAGLSDVEAMAREPGVSRIGLDRRVQALRAEARPMIKADAAESSYGVNGTGVKIAIVDTGVWDHSEFGNRITAQKCFCTGCCYGGADESSNGTDDNGHGTHVAGVAAGAEGNGTASNASIIAVKVLDADGNGYDSDVAKGIEWAIDNGADIIQLSLGTSYSAYSNCYEAGVPSSAAVDNATSQGKLVVIAAGNSGSGSATIAAPGCAKRPITVGNVKDGSSGATPAGQVWTTSSRGPTKDNRTKPDLMAPGRWITSTVIDGYDTYSGTSQASPFVSGAAALLYQQYKRDHGVFPAPDLAKAIIINAVNNTAPRNNTYGSGMIDAAEALRSSNFTRNGTISQGQEIAYAFNVTNNATRATLVWSDNSTQSNNLDLRVQAPDGTNYSWGGDANDTVESVLMSGEDGMWKLFVRGTTVSGSAAYYVAANGQITSIDGLNVTSIQRGQSWGAWSVFGSPVNYSFTEYNVTPSLANFSSAVTGYIVNHTNATGNDWSLGWHNVRFYANHSDGTWETSASQSFLLWGWSENNQSIIPGSATEDVTAAMSCCARDANTTAPLGGYGVSFYGNASLIGTNATDSTGWATLNYAFATPGSYNVSCAIASNATSYYNASNSTRAATVTVNDTTAPQYSSLVNSTAVYDSNFRANATWTDNGAIGAALFESNFSGTLTNYTAPNASASYYFTVLSANHTGGAFVVWKWYANDTGGNANATQQYNYTVSKAATLTSLYLNGSSSSASYLYGSSINITASLNVTKSVAIEANYSGSSAAITSGAPPLTNLTNSINLNASGTVYNITASYAGSENYSVHSTTLFLTVKNADGASCSAASACYNGYCVHGSCRSASTYCGDGTCDTGESCTADCGTASNPSGPASSGSSETNGTEAAANGTSNRSAVGTASKSCPACQECGSVSACSGGNATKTCYYCDETTGYECKEYEAPVKCSATVAEEIKNRPEIVYLTATAAAVAAAAVLIKKKKLFMHGITRKSKRSYTYRG